MVYYMLLKAPIQASEFAPQPRSELLAIWASWCKITYDVAGFKKSKINAGGERVNELPALIFLFGGE
jgi:hypothetical protein